MKERLVNSILYFKKKMLQLKKNLQIIPFDTYISVWAVVEDCLILWNLIFLRRRAYRAFTNGI